MATEAEKKFPGFTGEQFPEKFDIRAMPKQPEVRKPGQLLEDQIRQFFTKADLYEEHGYHDRLVKLEQDFPGANILCFKQMAVVPKALKAIWTNERLLNLMEQLIGPDIAGHPVWNIRTKTPRNSATTVPWHQDNAYLDLCSYKTLIPTAWIPFLDTDENNGCLQFIEEGHRLGMVAPHTCCYKDTWYITMQEKDMERTLGVSVKDQLRTVPLKYGGMVLFNNILPHQSLDNVSDHVRWSVDLRFQRPQDPACLFGVKDNILLRSSADPSLKPDWDKFDNINRHSGSMDQVDIHTKEEITEITDFDTHVFGPVFGHWELVNVNRHVQKYLDSEMTKH